MFNHVVTIWIHNVEWAKNVLKESEAIRFKFVYKIDLKISSY